MPTTYSEAPKAVIATLDGVIDEFFPEVRRCSPEPVISVLMAENEDGEALKKFGAGVVALIKKSTKEDKAEGGPDLRILIDAERWADSNDRRRRAILAHELRHVEIQWLPGGKDPQLDAYGRPKIKLLPDDWVLTGFRDVAEWFGEDAVEVRAVRSVHDSLRQLGLSFMRDEAASIVNGRVAEIEAEAGEYSTVARDAFAALISVGHTDQQARDAIDRVLASGQRPGSVSDMIDAVYQDNMDHGKATPSEPLSTSVSFSGKDFDIIAEAGKKLRGKGRREAIVGADAGR